MDELEDVEEEGGGKSGGGGWMATFADMMTLLLCFFVLLLSFATMDIIKFTEMIGSMHEAFGAQQEMVAQYQALSTSPIEFSETETSADLDILEQPSQGKSREAEARELVTEVQEAVRRLELEDSVEVENEDRGVVLRVSGKLLFDPGGDRLHPASEPFLAEIAAIAGRVPNALSVEGHSDDRPIRTGRYPSNWHLAAGRAIAAVRYLAEEGGIERSRLAATSYGPTRPLVANDSAEHRATNRRVEFVFLRDGQAHSRFAPGTPARVLDEAGAFD